MNRIFSILLFILFLSCPVRAGNLLVNAHNFVSQGTVNRRITLTLLDPGATTAGPWLIAGDSVAQFTDTNGITTFTNVLAGGYRLDIGGAPSRSFPFGMPDTNGVTLNVTALIGATNTSPYFYTAAQIDALLAGDTALLQGSNTWTGTTNNFLGALQNNGIPVLTNAAAFQPAALNLSNYSTLPTNTFLPTTNGFETNGTIVGTLQFNTGVSLNDHSGIQWADPNGRFFYDQSANRSIGFQQRQLENVSGIATLDWNNTQLLDPGTGVNAVQWGPGGHSLGATNGTIILNFSQAANFPQLTASRAMVSDGSSNLTNSVTTATQLGYLSTATSDVQVQLNGKVSQSLNGTDFASAQLTSSNIAIIGISNRSILPIIADTSAVTGKFPGQMLITTGNGNGGNGAHQLFTWNSFGGVSNWDGGISIPGPLVAYNNKQIILDNGGGDGHLLITSNANNNVLGIQNLHNAGYDTVDFLDDQTNVPMSFGFGNTKVYTNSPGAPAYTGVGYLAMNQSLPFFFTDASGNPKWGGAGLATKFTAADTFGDFVRFKTGTTNGDPTNVIFRVDGSGDISMNGTLSVGGFTHLTNNLTVEGNNVFFNGNNINVGGGGGSINVGGLSGGLLQLNSAGGGPGSSYGTIKFSGTQQQWNLNIDNTNLTIYPSGQAAWLSFMNAGYIGVGQNVQMTNLVTVYNGVATVDAGHPALYASVHSLGNSGQLGPSTLYTPSSTNGIYRISGVVSVTTAGTGTNAVKITYSGSGGANIGALMLVQDITGSLMVTNSVPLTALGQFPLLPMVIQSTNSAIQYSTINNLGGGAKYDLHLELEALNLK